MKFSKYNLIIKQGDTSILFNTLSGEIYSLDRITFTHKMSKIICINEGRVAEIGAPDVLLKNPNSLYKEMYDLNTAKYIKS